MSGGSLDARAPGTQGRMRIVVTGAGGFLGKRLAQRLAASGHEVIAIVRRDPSPEDRHYFDSPSIRLLKADLAILDCRSLPGGVGAVYALAQSSHYQEFPKQARDIFAVNVAANAMLLQWAAESGVGKFLYASSGGVYGGRAGGRLEENDPLAIDRPLGFYLGSKLCVEVLLQSYRDLFETTVILRPFFMYGAGQRRDMLIARLAESVRHGWPISLQGRDGLRLNPVFVEDAATAFAQAQTMSGSHVINVAGPDVLTLREIAGRIGAALGRAPVFEHRDGNPVDHVGGTHAVTARLGVKLTPFDSGIRSMLSAG